MKRNISDSLQKILDARHHDPFEYLGRHIQQKNNLIRAYIPRARTVIVHELNQEMSRIEGTDAFEWEGADEVPQHYQLRWTDDHGNEITRFDPYCFGPQLADFDLSLFSSGKHWHIQRFLGANPWRVGDVEGVLFATWAPNAERVSVIGDFNQWDGRTHAMRNRGGSGVWEIFVPGIYAGELYKFEIRNRDSGNLVEKIDPYGKQFEMRPSNSSIVVGESQYAWQDNAWIDRRQQANWLQEPISIYEVHLGSWRRDEQNQFLDYRRLAHELVDHVKHTGFTHIELLPITEHPLDASWGYQTLGYFAPTSRFGTPDDFRYFIDYCHQHEIGVLLDWVPAHFPMDSHGLGRFDGTALYEHEDPRRGEHRDWGTFIYNFGRNEVKNFLLANALYWLEEFHIDGLRVDAVASMLYLDYSREEGDWEPNQYGGRENLEAIDFLRELNTLTHSQQPGTMVIAEESTAWPQVSRPVYLGGLGFSLKWNMGWMHDTLTYMQHDPIHRMYHHDNLTFGLLYSFTENFVLPFSHDEVVHGKSSMRLKMPGDEWQQFANLRLLYCYMFSYPGKKLLFMGCEFGQGSEWNFDQQLEWYVLQYPLHSGLQQLVADLNKLYRNVPALHRKDCVGEGFEWIDCHDASQSILSYIRRDDSGYVIVLLNFTPMIRENYRIGVPENTSYRELLNTDADVYGGSNVGNGAGIQAEEISWMGRPFSINVTVPPLGALIISPT